MRRIVLGALVLFAVAAPARADVLVLKSGRKIVGKVVEKPDAYEATVEGQSLVFSRDEVARWIRSPKEIIGDADRLVEEAKALYREAVEMKDAGEAERKFREALPKVIKAREAYAEARDLFPDGYSEMDVQLVNIMKLMRLIRERIGSEVASAPVVARPAPPPPPPKLPAPAPAPAPDPVPPAETSKGGIGEALAVMIDPARRSDEKARSSAREALRSAWETKGLVDPDIASAGHLFLSRDDKDWQLVTDSVFVRGSAFQSSYRGRLVRKSADLSVLEIPGGKEVRIRKGPEGMLVVPPGGSEFPAEECRIETDQKSESYQALQDFFSGLGPEKLKSLPEKEVLNSLTALSRKTREILARQAEAPVESLRLFVAAFSSALIARSGGKPAPELESVLKEMGYEKSEFGPVWGDKVGLAVDDFRKWAASGEYGLAVVQFGRDYAALDEFVVRYAHGLLLLLKAVGDNRYYGRPASHFELMARSAPTQAVREHLASLAKSIREAAPCMACGGTHQVNCSACKGRKKVNMECATCGGSGKVQTFNGVQNCRGCKGKGRWDNADCPKCKATGKVECKARYCTRAVEAPRFESFAEAMLCTSCKGMGTVIRHVAIPCLDCGGIGMTLRPKADPSKTLR